jgi:hypothetical protein
LLHRREKRVEPRSQLDVVEAHERDIVRDFQAGAAHGFDRAERNEVVHCEHGRRRFLHCEEPAHSEEPPVGIRRLYLDERRVERKVRSLQRVLVTLPALTGGRDLVALDDEADALVAEADQVLDEQPRTPRAVANDGVGVDSVHRSVNQHERDAELGQPRQVGFRPVADGGDGDPLDAVGNQLLHDIAFDCEIRAGVAEDHAVGRAPSNLLGGAYDQREERV